MRDDLAGIDDRDWIMVLKLERVAKTHVVGHREKKTLRDVTLRLSAGDVVGVYGNHRSGKSTLLRIAAGLERPDSGEVLVAGTNLATLSRAQLGALRLNDIGLVGASGPHTTELSVIEYVAFPLFGRYKRREARARAVAALRRVGAEDCLGATWRQLSDCERALVSLAHGLARSPALLLVDDVMSGLNALQQDEITKLLMTAARNERLAVLVASSSMNALVGTHESYDLSDGVLKPISVPAAADVVTLAGRRDETA